MGTHTGHLAERGATGQIRITGETRVSRAESPPLREARIAARRATLADLLRLPPLFARAVREDYAFYPASVQAAILRRHALRALLSAWLNVNRLVLVARHRSSVAGVLLGVCTVDGVAAVTWLYVQPEQRGVGIGSLLVRQAEQVFAGRGCHKITVTTESAPAFYQSLGYVQEGLLKRHWWQQDFYVFSKFLR